MKKNLRDFAIIFLAMSLLVGFTSCSNAVAPTVTESDTTPPANVTDLTVVASNGNAVLTWTNPTDADFNGVEVSVSPATGTLANPVILAKGVTSLSVSGLTNGTEYTFAVKSIDTSLNKSSGTTKVTTVTPVAVGDIVLNDGTRVAVADIESITVAQKANAVGVIGFIKDDDKAFIVGLELSDYLQWAPIGTTGETTNFTDIQSTRNGSDGSYTFTGDTDGSNNWTYICSIDPEAEASVATNYPAFNYVNNYATTAGLTGTYAVGWYMPSIAELYEVYKNRETIDASLTAAGGSSLGTSVYWSSSQYNVSGTNYAWHIYFKDGNVYYYNMYRYKDVLVIRAF